MAADGTAGGPGHDQVTHIFATFAREVFNPMVALSGVSTAERRRLLDEIRRRLDVVEQVIATADAATYPMPGFHAPISETSPSDLTAAEADAEGSALDEIGRNQRSRVRELVLLEALSREAKAYSLQQLMGALTQRGFQDTPSAVVSQLHRLKKLELIRQPANSTGMYEITNAGLGHARNLRSSFGAYVP
ncbi:MULTISPECIES: hypothetical protein [Hyphomicrobium]|jgi:hypothetical protein|uniref:hypothetical protein n=1 Tax=Hyphomicrobium TaxID=81 RepID=UPI00036086AC|nr:MULTISPECIES: hypothetical protein [Hyphomicrobium]WBT36589.1 hypothetical protein PE058_13090 [Hyphomicrobium sp. DMF-1]HML42841.1 hypothetical protein [Hyphomicrobium zavarzinii]